MSVIAEMAPSTELRNWFAHDPARWEKFCDRYDAELHQNAELLGQLRALAREGSLTLIFSAHYEVHNDSILLRQVILGRKVRHAEK